MILPCVHDSSATAQVQPTVDLLQTLDAQHPDILRSHAIEPSDYHPKLVFRSAVESIRGTYIASSLTQRQGLVANVLDSLKMRSLIADFEPQGPRERFDFTVLINRRSRETAAIEVTGGEGNSINISERPLWASEFLVWCHLDGAIVNQPSHGAAAIIFNRISSEMVKRRKQVDAVVFKDARCHTPLRPCPKYSDRQAHLELGVAPDIFLMPQSLPSEETPNPPTHDINTLQLPAKLLNAHGVAAKDFDDHIWQVSIELAKDNKGRVSRVTKVFHKGKLMELRRSLR